MGVSPMSKHIAGDGGNRHHVLHRSKNRNEASAKDLFVYHWPLNSPAAGEEGEEGEEGESLLSSSRRGSIETDMGVPLDFRSLDFSALDYSAERLERYVLSIMRDTGTTIALLVPRTQLSEMQLYKSTDFFPFNFYLSLFLCFSLSL